MILNQCYLQYTISEIPVTVESNLNLVEKISSPFLVVTTYHDGKIEKTFQNSQKIPIYRFQYSILNTDISLYKELLLPNESISISFNFSYAANPIVLRYEYFDISGYISIYIFNLNLLSKILN